MVLVTTTRTEARHLGLEEGLPVWIEPAEGTPTVPAVRSTADDDLAWVDTTDPLAVDRSAPIG